MTTATITKITARNVVLELPQTLHLGAMTVHRREYTLVQVENSDGLLGKAYCLSREAPMAEIIGSSLLSPHVLGMDTDDVNAIWDKAYRGSAIVGRVGLVVRALGLLDIALWDLAAQQRALPLWQLLGTGDEPRQSLLVSTYPTSGRTATDIAQDVLDHAQQGWKVLKIARSADTELMREVLTILSQSLAPECELVVDVGFGWPDAEAALTELAAWGNPRLGWLEDPLLPEDIAGCARIRSETGMAIGIGDEVTDPSLFDRYIEADAIDVARIDVVALGGITPAMKLLPRLRDAGLRVSSHVSPEASVHLGVEVETFDRSSAGNPYDPSPTLISGGPAFLDGYAQPPSTPGLGFEFAPDIFKQEEQ